ncbi:hypothetical protein [Halobellus salinisoli]
MTALLHLGVEHPSALWLVGVGLLTFVAGLLVNLYRSRRSDGPLDAADR